MAAFLISAKHAARWMSPPRAAVLLALAVIAVIWVAAWQRSQFETAKALASATRANSNLAIAYEENAANAIGDVDQTLRLVESEIRLEGPAAAKAIPLWPLDRALLRGLSVVGADGKAISVTGEVANMDMDRRDDFAFHREHRSGALRIGNPERMPSSGAWNVAMSRRMDKPDGSFAGIVVAMVDPKYFVDFYGRSELGEHDVVSLVGRDGIALARHATGANSYGDDMRASTLFRELAERPRGTFASVGRLDGIERLMSYRTMARYPLVVMVGTSREDTLAAVEERTRLYYLLAALASNVVALVAIGFLRSLARQRRDLEAITIAQARLRESELRSKAITENMAGGVITTDFDGAIRSVNSAACHIYGLTLNEMLKRNICNLVHESRRALVFAVFDELRSRGDDFQEDSREVLCVRKDGTPFETEVLLSSVTVGSERIYIGIVHDISNRKRMERELRSSEAHLRATFDQALVGIVHTSLDGRILRVNQTTCKQLGYSEEELLTLGYRDITHPEDLPLSVTRIEALHADPKRPFVYQVTKRLLRKDGTVMWALSAVCLIRGAEGNPDFLLSMVQDITELKRLEQMKNEFVSTVSREPPTHVIPKPFSPMQASDEIRRIWERHG